VVVVVVVVVVVKPGCLSWLGLVHIYCSSLLLLHFHRGSYT